MEQPNENFENTTAIDFDNSNDSPVFENDNETDIDKAMSSYQNFINENKIEKPKEITKEYLENAKTALVNVKKFMQENKGFMDSDANKKAVFYALEHFGGKADLNTVKTLLDSARKEAVSEQAAKSVQNRRLENMQGVKTADTKKSSAWFTKAEIDEMSDNEYVKNGQKIALQMSLEKQGKLPKTII